MSTSLPADYTTRSASQKLELLWEAVRSDPYPKGGLPTQEPGPWPRRRLLSVKHNRISFDHTADEMPPERTKLVHAHGTVARATLQIDDARGYTGIFGSGSDLLLRVSDATGGGTFTPSLALKFMIDGAPSVNLMALPATRRDPEDRDWLTSPYSNATLPPDALNAKVVQHAFQRTANALGGKRLYAIFLPLHHIAQIETSGTSVPDASVPDRLEFHPTTEARAIERNYGDWRDGLTALPAGLVLFDVRATSRIDETPQSIGELRLESEFVASRYGDERLFFQHDVGPT